MTKVLFIYGTRPEGIKLAPVINKMKSMPKRFDVKVCVTAQHREMLDQVNGIFNITPDYDLDIMLPNQSLYDITANGLKGLERVMEAEKPDMVLVQGDTTTTFIGGLAAFYSRVPVAHVEAGLRTFDKYYPYPEEINRRLTTNIADLHFAPTTKARDNLLGENIEQDRIFVTGNTGIDALFSILKKQEDIPEQKKWNKFFKDYGVSLDSPGRVILVTGHRRENFGEGFRNVSEALKEIALSNRDVAIVYPVHLNPNVQGPVKQILGKMKNIFLIPPLDYEPFVYLMKRAYLILTDSGGVQEEAPSLGKPVLVMRETSERPEAVEVGTARLVGTDRRRIVGSTSELLGDRKAYEAISMVHNPYGDGRAAERIIRILGEYFGASGQDD